MGIDTIKVSFTDLAWAAGIVDGEGSIGIYRAPQRRYPGLFSYRVSLHVANTDPRMLLRMEDIFGGRIYPMRKSSGQQRPLGQWVALNADALTALRAMRPYLVCKADQADVALQYRTGRRGLRVTREQYAVRDGLIREIADLKRLPKFTVADTSRERETA